MDEKKIFENQIVIPPRPPGMPEWISRAELISWLGISSQTVHNWRNKGTVTWRYVGLPSRCLYEVSSVEQAIREKRIFLEPGRPTGTVVYTRPPEVQGEDWYTSSELAEKLGISYNVVDSWLSQGKLRGKKVPKTFIYYIHKSEVENAIQERRILARPGRPSLKKSLDKKT